MMTGTIHCKFFSGESEIRNLGRYLQDKMRSSFRPHFIITDNSNVPTEERKIKISRSTTSYMMEQGSFRLADITINVSAENVITNIDLSVVSGHRFPISGFPRALMQQPPPICKLILRNFSCLCPSTTYIMILRIVHTSLLKEKNNPMVPPGPGDHDSDHFSDRFSAHSSEEDRDLVSDDEQESRGRSSRYQASSTVRRPDMVFTAHGEHDSEEW